jgi:hypothetical protein
VQNDDLAHLRNSLRRSSAVAQGAAQPRVIEAFPATPRAIPERRRSYRQVTLSAIPIVAALVSTSLLAYFMLFSERPYASLQQEGSQERSGEELQQQEPQQGVPRDAAQSAAQQRQEGSSQLRQQPSQPQQPNPIDLGPRLPMPSDAKLLILITSSLLALDQANATANYTVLWDSAAPAFQQMNSPEHLAEVFNSLRARNLDLSPIVLLQPRLFRRPEMNEQGMIRVAGFFPTEPDRVNFDLIYQPVQGKWRLVGMAVDTSPAPAQPEATAPPQVRSAPNADNPESKAETPKEASEAEKPPAPSRKPKDKPKATQEAGNTPQNAKPKIDVRDRIDNPPKPEPEKLKESGWNPFGR